LATWPEFHNGVAAGLKLARVPVGHLTSPHFTSLHLTSPHFTSLHLTSPHLASLHCTSCPLTSLHLTSPHLNSPHLTSYTLPSPRLSCWGARAVALRVFSPVAMLPFLQHPSQLAQPATTAHPFLLIQTFTRAWVVYNRPVEASSAHGGLLMALGLRGHLRVLAPTDFFRDLALVRAPAPDSCSVVGACVPPLCCCVLGDAPPPALPCVPPPSALHVLAPTDFFHDLALVRALPFMPSSVCAPAPHSCSIGGVPPLCPVVSPRPSLPCGVPLLFSPLRMFAPAPPLPALVRSPPPFPVSWCCSISALHHPSRFTVLLLTS
ncbi:unnamed protein product, partial [Closterium sp. NIES-54]